MQLPKDNSRKINLLAALIRENWFVSVAECPHQIVAVLASSDAFRNIQGWKFLTFLYCDLLISLCSYYPRCLLDGWLCNRYIQLTKSLRPHLSKLWANVIIFTKKNKLFAFKWNFTFKCNNVMMPLRGLSFDCNLQCSVSKWNESCWDHS